MSYDSIKVYLYPNLPSVISKKSFYIQMHTHKVMIPLGLSHDEANEMTTRIPLHKSSDNYITVVVIR